MRMVAFVSDRRREDDLRKSEKIRRTMKPSFPAHKLKVYLHHRGPSQAWGKYRAPLVPYGGRLPFGNHVGICERVGAGKLQSQLL